MVGYGKQVYTYRKSVRFSIAALRKLIRRLIAITGQSGSLHRCFRTNPCAQALVSDYRAYPRRAGRMHVLRCIPLHWRREPFQ
jgi:hypothetical protein